MTPVESSNIKAVGYDPESQVMRVEFHSGGVYDHHKVSPEVHDAILKASSHGKHYNLHIRGVHTSTKIK